MMIPAAYCRRIGSRLAIRGQVTEGLMSANIYLRENSTSRGLAACTPYLIIAEMFIAGSRSGLRKFPPGTRRQLIPARLSEEAEFVGTCHPGRNFWPLRARGSRSFPA
jgi:hypothetical protein